jgi:outer membrane lipoprotein-sorting protein
MRGNLCVTLAASLLFAGAGLVRADGEADARKVIDRAIKAHGSADKLAQLKAHTFKLKGKYYGMSADGTDYTGEWSIQAPDKFRMEISGQGFKFVNVVNGNKGWVQVMGNTQEMDKEALAESKETLYAGRVTNLVNLKEKGFTFAPLGEAKVGKRDAVGIRVSHKGHRDINLFFDKKTHMLLKSERRAKDTMGGGEFTGEEFYEEYKEVGGIQHAHKIRILRDGKKFVDGETTDFMVQDKLDDSLFDKP